MQVHTFYKSKLTHQYLVLGNVIINVDDQN